MRFVFRTCQSVLSCYTTTVTASLVVAFCHRNYSCVFSFAIGTTCSFSKAAPVLTSFHNHPVSSSRKTFPRAMSSTTASSNTTDNMFKRAKPDDDSNISDKVIGTHSGTFQADEAMGCFLLRQLPTYRDAKIVRTRDPKVLDTLDIVIDVGGIYDHEKLRYDHHQRGYEERFEYPRLRGASTGEQDEIRCTKLSAAGLVYRHYGKEVIQTFYPNLTSTYLDLAYVQLYDALLEALDAIDTGVEMTPEGTLAVYRDLTGLSSRVKRLNPRWNEDIDSETGNPPSHDERFERAVQMCGVDFMSVLTAIVESDIPARDLVEQAVIKRFESDSSGKIIVLENGGLPWRNHLYDLEKVHQLDPLIHFVLYPDISGMWRVQAVTMEGMGFQNRLSLPEAWRGVRDEDLASVTRIPGSRFVHAAGFIGGADTYEGVLQMAREALIYEDSKSSGE